MFLSGLFITVPYSVSYLTFATTGKADYKLPIVMNSFRHLHSSPRFDTVRSAIWALRSTRSVNYRQQTHQSKWL